MNRCRRCATVISGAITAGVLYAGVGAVVGTPAGADPAASGETAGSDAATTGVRGDSNATGMRRPRTRSSSPVSSGPAVSDSTVSVPRSGRVLGGRAGPAPDRTGDAVGEIGEHWHCQWWPFIEPVRPPEPVGFDNGNWMALQGPVAVTAPVAELVGGVAPELPRLDLALASPTAAPTAPASAAAPALVPGDPSPPARAGAERPAAAPLAGPPQRSPSPPPPRTSPVAALPESVRLGYPEYLRHADFREVAAVALPGLAAILGLTALGGLLGYRQARAGQLLPAAGAGRFLR